MTLRIGFLGLGAAGCGLVLAASSLRLLDYFPDPVPAARIDARIVGFALGLSVVFGLAASVIAAWRAVRTTSHALLLGARVIGSVSGHRVRHRLLSLQIALAVILLVCASLFVRSAAIAMAVDTGVDDDRLLVAGVDFSGAGGSYPPDVREHFYAEAVRHLTSLPAIRGASLAQFAPLSFGSWPGAWSISPDRKGVAPLNTVGDGYFATVGTPIVAGRSFDATDAAGSPPVAVVNQAVARMIAADGNVVGTCVAMQRQIKSGGCTLIVGVAKTQRSRYLADAQAPLIFMPRSQVRDAAPWGSPVVLVRTSDDPALHVSAVHTLLQGLAPSLPYVAVRPLSDSFKTDLLPFRLGALLFSAFGLLTLALTAVGLFGVLLEFVTDRQAEIGVRRALGGSGLAIGALILRQGLSSLLAGVSIGMAAAFVGTGYLASLLFGVSAKDPSSFVAAGTVVVLATLLSTLVPLWRGLRVDAAVAIRQGAV